MTETRQIDPQAVKFIENARYYNPQGFTAGTEQDIYNLISRVEELPSSEHISAKAIAGICGYSALLRHPFTIVSHRESHTMQEKSEFLLADCEPKILLLKTVTFRVEHEGQAKYFLLAGLGDFSIDRQAKMDLQPAVKRILKTDKNVFGKGLKINPPEFNPREVLDVNAGIVSPFIDLEERSKGFCPKIEGLFYYHNDLIVEEFVAIAASLTDTIIVDGKCFPGIMNFWQGMYLNIPFRFIRRSEQDRVEK